MPRTLGRPAGLMARSQRRAIGGMPEGQDWGDFRPWGSPLIVYRGRALTGGGSVTVLRWLVALSLVAVPSTCMALPTVTPPNRFADIHFDLAIPTAQNDQLRRRLIRIGVTEQMRGGPIGISGAVFGDPGYAVQIVGQCKGAVREVGELIRRVSKDLPNRRGAEQSYHASAKCIAKRTRVPRL